MRPEDATQTMAALVARPRAFSMTRTPAQQYRRSRLLDALDLGCSASSLRQRKITERKDAIASKCTLGEQLPEVLWREILDYASLLDLDRCASTSRSFQSSSVDASLVGDRRSTSTSTWTEGCYRPVRPRGVPISNIYEALPERSLCERRRAPRDRPRWPSSKRFIISPERRRSGLAETVHVPIGSRWICATPLPGDHVSDLLGPVRTGRAEICSGQRLRTIRFRRRGATARGVRFDTFPTITLTRRFAVNRMDGSVELARPSEKGAALGRARADASHVEEIEHARGIGRAPS